MHICLNRFSPAALLLTCLAFGIYIYPVQGLGDDSDLTYYNDTFEALNEDNWDRAQYTHNPEQLKNFKLGDLEVVDNRLLITTRPGAFSKAGLSSRYVFRGDFDVQIDCRIDFKKSLVGMDQMVSFAISTKPEDTDAWWVAIIRLQKIAKRKSPRIIFLNVKDRKAVSHKYKETDSFNGSLRFTREGKKITALFQKKGSTRWHTLGYTSHFTNEDVFVGFVIQNFQVKRRTIKAKDTFEVAFDNFKINHADEVVEDEI